MSSRFDRTDREAMKTAIAAARLGPRGANPLVGAVITDRAGEVLHVGHHRGAGTDHAEVDAIGLARRAGTDLTRTRMYVTLEPCHRTGRTGPCSRAVLEAGIPELVLAQADVTTSAGGAEFLTAHGMHVRTGLLRTEAAALNDRWWRTRAEHRPFVTAKIAATQDGRVAAPDGTSRWITGPASRAHGHRLRRRVDAILVGTGTALADDPRLTAREPDGTDSPRQPRRVVVGRRDLPKDAALHQGTGALRLRTHDPREVLAALSAEGLEHVLIEGGPTQVGAFLTADLVDEIYWYAAPMLLGAGAPAVPDLGIGTLSGRLAWTVDPAGSEEDATREGVARLGADVMTHLAPLPLPGPAGTESKD